MRDVTVTTKASGREYDVTCKAFESLDEAREFWSAKGENPDDVLLGILNAAQEQNAKQGGKQVVRKAISESGDAHSEAVDEAIVTAQEYAQGYVIGSPRGGTLRAGVTKTQAKEFGVEVASSATPEQMAEIREILGLD